jgi:hypothetical protein
MVISKFVKRLFTTGVLAPVLLLACASVPAGRKPKGHGVSLCIVRGTERV